MKIIYCHHAQRDKKGNYNQLDGLTEYGIKDANLNAELFKMIQEQSSSIKAIYTSTYYRCMLTAKFINKYINVPIIEEDRFNEYVKSDNKETWLDVQNRILDGINNITNKYNDKDTIICVTSGVNVGAFICWNFGIKPYEKLPFIGVSSCSPLIFNYTSDNNYSSIKFFREKNADSIKNCRFYKKLQKRNSNNWRIEISNIK